MSCSGCGNTSPGLCPPTCPGWNDVVTTDHCVSPDPEWAKAVVRGGRDAFESAFWAAYAVWRPGYSPRADPIRMDGMWEIIQFAARSA